MTEAISQFYADTRAILTLILLGEGNLKFIVNHLVAH